MSTLKEMVRKILKSYSYEVVEDRDGGIFVAKKEDRLIMVCAAPDGDAELAESARQFVSSTADFKGQRVIATLSASVPQEIIIFAEESGVALWNHGVIESELGRLMMRAFVEKEQADAVEDDIDDVEKFEPSLDTRVRDWGEQIVNPRITLEDVTELAKYTIRGFRYELELVPYYIFEYFCDVVVDGHDAGEKRVGLIGVNALSGDYEQWKTRFGLVPELQWAHTKLEPKIDGEKAEHVAHEGVVSLNTSERENVVDRGTALIIEKRKVRPKEGAVILKRKGLVYLPVWCVEGSNGIMLVNAVTGKIIKEDFYKESG
jgi:hypothetical protein